MKKIYYWSPYIGNIATVKAVINSAYSLTKFSKNKFIPTILNSCGEWDIFKEELNNKKINVLGFNNSFKINTKINGFFKSRITYIKVFITCFFSLKKTILNDKPNFLIAHLITSLPIFLFLIFKFDTKLIIRVSGKVNMNIFRKILWKISKKKIFLITCPTEESKNELIKLNIIDKSKVIFLPDPVIDIHIINKKKKEKKISFDKNEKYFLSIGRFTKQKNHLLIINCFSKICQKYPDIKLLIIGSGELKNKYLDAIKKYDLEKKIYLIDHQKNIFNYLKSCIALISTSLWEDPGFVMIEAAASNTLVISSDCPCGPKEFIGTNSGLLFVNNNSISLEKKILQFLDMNDDEIKKLKINAKKKSIKFTKLNHYQILSSHFNNLNLI